MPAYVTDDEDWELPPMTLESFYVPDTWLEWLANVRVPAENPDLINWDD